MLGVTGATLPGTRSDKMEGLCVVMGDTVFLPLQAYFSRTGMRWAIVLCELPLTITATLVVGLAALFHPSTLADPTFLLVTVLHIAVLTACLVLPWEKLPPGSFVIIPVSDCFVVGLMWEVGGPVLSVVGLLMAFPVIWLSVTASRTRVTLAIMAALCATVTSPLVVGNPVEREELIRMIVFPLIMAGLAITAHFVAKGVIRYRGRLESKDLELLRLHEATKEHDQLLDTVLETINVGVWAMDATGAEILTNRRFRADRSWAQESEDATNPFFLCSDPYGDKSDSPASLAAQGRSFTSRLVTVGSGEFRRTFSAAARPLQSVAGSLNGSVVAFTDVTALVKAQSARDKFVATVSHELRTPLTNILGYMEMLKDQPDPKFMGIIERNAQRLLTLVNDLLLVASEDLELRRRPTNVSDLVQQSIRTATPDAASRGITIEAQIHRNASADVDPGQLSKAIGQLLSNAIKFSPEDSQVTVSLRGAPGELELSVSDQGMGMTQQEQEQAFTKFFRTDRAMETAVQGAGLGLPLSKAIIEAHGGTIHLNSSPGSGTTVKVAIPA